MEWGTAGRPGSVLRGTSTYQKSILSQDRCSLEVLKRGEQSAGWAEPPGGQPGARVLSSEGERLSFLRGSERAEVVLAPQHRANSVRTRAFAPSNSILGTPHPESQRHRSPSGLLPPSTPGPRPRACCVHQLRLPPSRCCLGFNFCVALRKLPIITARERKQSPCTAVLQLCSLQSAAGRGCGPGRSGRGCKLQRLQRLAVPHGVARGAGVSQKHPLSIIVTNEAFGEI